VGNSPPFPPHTGFGSPGYQWYKESNIRQNFAMYEAGEIWRREMTTSEKTYNLSSSNTVECYTISYTI
jgi:hypothetical protein